MANTTNQQLYNLVYNTLSKSINIDELKMCLDLEYKDCKDPKYHWLMECYVLSVPCDLFCEDKNGPYYDGLTGDIVNIDVLLSVLNNISRDFGVCTRELESEGMV